MKLVLERSGGVAGLRKPPLVVDTHGLPSAARTHLEALADAAGLAALPATLGDTAHDQLGYTLSVTRDDGASHTIELTLDAAPPALRALISELRKHARSI